MAGICTAYFLTEMGVQDILLVDKDCPLSLTSSASAETYCNWWPEESMYRFVNRSTAIMENLAEETGNVFNLNRRGECYVATTADKASEFQVMARRFAHLGLGPSRVHDSRGQEVQRYQPPEPSGFENAQPGSDLLLDKRSIQAHFPILSEEVTAVLHARSCGWFSAHTLGMILLEKAKNGGVRELRAEVVAVEQDSQGVSSVRTRSRNTAERVETRCFVNAAGPFVKQVANLLGVDLPVRTGLWEKIVFKDHLGIIPRSMPTLILKDELFLEWSEEEKEMLCEDSDDGWLLNRFSSGPYLRPEGGEDSPWVLAGWAYNEPPYKVERARDQDRVGAGVVCEPQWEPQLTRDFPEIVLRGLVRLVPGLWPYLKRLPKPMHDGGYYVETKDTDREAYREENPPLIGPMGIEGAYVVSACHGVSAGCAAGELCAAWVTGNELPDYAGDFSLSRYQGQKLS
jgi:glycine/D-amino acid oxidase-like deaminating enzyme